MSLLSCAKLFVTIWNCIAISIGILVVVVTSFFMFVRHYETIALPLVAFQGAAFLGGSLIVVSSIGGLGLRKHRKYVSEGGRNFFLIAFIAIGFFASAIVFLAGLVLIRMSIVIVDTQKNLTDLPHVQALESSIVENIGEYADKSTEKWITAQGQMNCCGLEDPSYLEGFLDQVYVNTTARTNKKLRPGCNIAIATCGQPNFNACQDDIKWCRSKFLSSGRISTLIVGGLTVAFGGLQFIAVVVTIFIMLFDSRTYEDKHREEAIREEKYRQKRNEKKAMIK